MAKLQLITAVVQHKVGDKVELEVLREGETIKVQAELTGWTPNKAADEKK